MDGTVINSITSAERCWTAWAIKHGLDVATFLPTIHGVKGTETIRRLGLPGVDPVKECQEILDAEMLDLDGIVPIPGAIEFLNSLPRDKWAIVTSAPRELALRRLDLSGSWTIRGSSALRLRSRHRDPVYAIRCDRC